MVAKFAMSLLNALLWRENDLPGTMSNYEAWLNGKRNRIALLQALGGDGKRSELTYYSIKMIQYHEVLLLRIGNT